MLSKSGLLSERERLPTRTLVFILTQKGYENQKGTKLLQVAGVPTQQVWFTEIRMWEQEPQPWWDFHPGVMALFPLCKHQMSVSAAVTQAATSIRNREMDGVRRAELLTSLGFFGKLMDRDLDVFALIGRHEVDESGFGKELAKDALERLAREHIAQVIKQRFGEEVLKEVAKALEGVSGEKALEDLFALVLKAKGANRVRKALAGK